MWKERISLKCPEIFWEIIRPQEKVSLTENGFLFAGYFRRSSQNVLDSKEKLAKERN